MPASHLTVIKFDKTLQLPELDAFYFFVWYGCYLPILCSMLVRIVDLNDPISPIFKLGNPSLQILYSCFQFLTSFIFLNFLISGEIAFALLDDSTADPSTKNRSGKEERHRFKIMNSKML
jgi:hypothetical protein